MFPWRLARLSLLRGNLMNGTKQNALRSISTSDKNREAVTAAPESSTCSATEKKSNVKSTWQTYGFALNEKEDHLHMHLSFFFGVTLLITMSAFYIAYAPNTVDWEQREAFLELRKRERLGLPLVDPNYVDPSRIVLPPDEELDDSAIII